MRKLTGSSYPQKTFAADIKANDTRENKDKK
jgi:hypothetical protein